MKQNMGSADRIIRLMIAALLAGLYLAGAITGWLAIAALVFAGVFTLTSILGFCPLYILLGINTCGIKR